MRHVFSLKTASMLVIVTSTLFCLLLPVTSADGTMSVYVVNYPLKYFAERIGGPHVKVTLPVPSDVDPVYWQPSIADIGAYQQADLILLNGAGYAKWVTKVSLPLSKTVNTSKSFKDRYITIKEVMTHSHGAEGEHAHEGLAFTTWLDLSLAIRQAEAIYMAFSRKRPDLSSKFKANYKVLKNDLELLDGQLKHLVSQKSSTPLFFSHTVYDYFIQRYGLNAKSVHWEPDQKPTTAQLSEFAKILKTNQARCMVWEDEPIKASIEELNEMGITSIVFNPCGNIPKKGDFKSVMQQNISQLETAFQ